MPNRMLVLAVRKEGMTPDEFKNHYETVHMPLMGKICGDSIPVSHHRRYPLRTGAPDENIPYDCVTELVYRDQEHMQAQSAILQSPEYQQTVTDDCLKFMDLQKTVYLVVGEDVETLGSAK